MQPKQQKPRRRKLWKFDQFANASNCFELDQLTPQAVFQFYGEFEAFLEVGAGTAEYSMQMARKYPDKRFIAVDIKADRLFVGARAALAANMENIWFLRAPIERLTEVIPAQSVDTLWITFPDPFPRKRSAKHRLTHPRFLEMYAQILKAHQPICFKTDNHDLFCWSLEQFAAQKWHLQTVTFDLHQSEVHQDAKLLTVYESRFIDEGLSIHFLRASHPILTR